MYVQHSPALCGLHSAALRSLLLGQLQCSCRVQLFDTAASSVLDGALITADVQPTFETYAEAFLQAPGRTSAQVDCALPIFDQAFAGDEHALASGNWFLDSGAKRNYVVNADPGFHTLPHEQQPCIGTAGDAVLYGVAVGDIAPQTSMQLPLHAAVHAPGLQHNLVSVGVLCDSTNLVYVFTPNGAYMAPAAQFTAASYPKIADRSPSTGHMYVCNPDHFPIARPVSAGVASPTDSACYTRQTNPAEYFHQANGHPSPARMELILSRGLVDNPPYTRADLEVLGQDLPWL